MRRSLPVDDREPQDTLVVRSLLAAGDKSRSLPADDREPQDTLVVRSLLAAGDKSRSLVSTHYDKVLGSLPTPVQRTVAAVLSRSRDPKPEELPTSHTSHQKSDESQAIT